MTDTRRRAVCEGASTSSLTAACGRGVAHGVPIFVTLLLSIATVLSGCGGSSHSAAATVTHPAVPKRSFSDVVASVQSGVIRIQTTTCTGGAVGTGILLSPTLVATVEHVVDGAQTITLKRSGKVVGHGTVVGSDSARDVALIRSDRPISGYRFKLAGRAPRLGEDVAAIGFPFGLPLTVTRGSVSGLGRTIPINGVNRTRLVQTDAAVNPGNSGGPLITDAGLVVGLVDLGSEQANGISFAVNAQTAGPLLRAWANAPQPVPASGCSSAGSQQAAPTQAPAQTNSQASWTTYPGAYFSIAYPNTWTVRDAEQSRGSYLDTTIVSPNDPNILIRVDVTPGANSPDPETAAAPVVAALRREQGYQELDYTLFSFQGYNALYWEFLVPEGGVLLHKVEVVFTSGNGDDFGLLVQAPDNVYSSYSTFFTDVLNSLTVN